MKTRFFAYGDSLTSWCYATHADLIGTNFDLYYNMGRPGSCNTFIADALFRDIGVYNFNPDTDFILITTTALNRFTWYDGNKWIHHGDLDIWYRIADTPDKIKPFLKHTWNMGWAIQRTFFSIRAIKNILTSLKIPHKIIEGLEMKSFITYPEEFNLTDFDIDCLKKTFECIEPYQSIDLFFRYHNNIDCLSYSIEDGEYDRHPTQYVYLDYIKKYLPEFYTDRALELHEKTFEDYFKKDYQNKLARKLAYEKFLTENYPNFLW